MAEKADTAPAIIVPPTIENNNNRIVDDTPVIAANQNTEKAKPTIRLADEIDEAEEKTEAKPKKTIILVDDVEEDDLSPIVIKKKTTDSTKTAAADNNAPKDTAAAKPADSKPAEAKAESKTADTKAESKTADTKAEAKAESKPADEKPAAAASAGGKVPTGKLITDAQAAMKSKDFDTAVQLLVQATTQEPNNFRAWLSLAKANEARGKLDLAISSAEKACKIQKAASCYNYLGDLYNKKGDTDSAQAAFKQAVAIDPNYTIAQQKIK